MAETSRNQAFERSVGDLGKKVSAYVSDLAGEQIDVSNYVNSLVHTIAARHYRIDMRVISADYLDAAFHGHADSECYDIGEELMVEIAFKAFELDLNSDIQHLIDAKNVMVELRLLEHDPANVKRLLRKTLKNDLDTGDFGHEVYVWATFGETGVDLRMLKRS